VCGYRQFFLLISFVRKEVRQEGEIKGLKGGIEMGITLKFPEDIDMMMALVDKVEGLDTLNKIKEALKTTQDRAEILALLN